MNVSAVKTSRAGFLTCFVITLFVLGCTDNGASLVPQNVEPDNTGAQGGGLHPSTAVHTYVDWSGTVEVTVYESYLQASGKQPSRTVLRAQVTDSNGVCIGGGAWMERLGGNYNGGVLTASYPDADKKTWWARGMSYIWPCPYILHAYAVGLRLKKSDGSYVPFETLSSTIGIVSGVGSQSDVPTAFATADPGYTIIGGGGFIDFEPGPGNVLVCSYPISSSQWRVQGKAQWTSSPACAYAYALTVPANWVVPGYGRMDAQMINGVPNYSNSWNAAFVARGSEFVPGCLGAKLENGDPGQLLYGLVCPHTDDRSMYVYSKAHGKVSDAYLTAYAIQLRRSHDGQ